MAASDIQQPVILLSPPQDDDVMEDQVEVKKPSFLRRKLSNLSLRKDVLLAPDDNNNNTSLSQTSSGYASDVSSIIPTPTSSTERARPLVVLYDKYKNYKKGKIIGTGATAKIRLLEPRHGGDKVVAMKIFKKKDKDETEKEYDKRMTSEFCISKTLYHQHVVQVFDLLKDRKGRWCSIMEYVSKEMKRGGRGR